MAGSGQPGSVDDARPGLPSSNEKILTVRGGYPAVHLGVAEVKPNGRPIAKGDRGMGKRGEGGGRTGRAGKEDYEAAGEYPPRHVRDH